MSGSALENVAWRRVDVVYSFDVSNDGRVRHPQSHNVYKLHNSDGYLSLTKRIKLHTLVALAFHGPPSEKQTDVRHLDNNKGNNHPSNVVRGTHLDNIRDSVDNGRHAHGSTHGFAKLTETDIPLIRDLITSGLNDREIGEKFGVTNGPISAIRHKRTWRHVK